LLKELIRDRFARSLISHSRLSPEEPGKGAKVKKSLPRLDSKFIVIAISVLLLLYFIVFPLLVLIYDSLFINGTFDISNYKDVYGKKVNWKALTNTIQISLIVMVASVIVTFPLAWLVGRTDLPGKKNVPDDPGCQLYDSAICGRYRLGPAAEPQRRIPERFY
jgi:hypothetical protein